MKLELEKISKLISKSLAVDFMNIFRVILTGDSEFALFHVQRSDDWNAGGSLSKLTFHLNYCFRKFVEIRSSIY